jgi:excisionase family DNA binding protein
MSERLFITARETADMLSLSRAKVYELVAAGKLPAQRFDGAVRINLPALRRLVAEQNERGEQ